MKRACAPEILDSLPHDHPEAIASRRDIRFINALMRNRPWFARTLPGLVRPGERILEVGAGLGELGLALGRRGVAVDGLDVCPRPPAWPPGQAWHRTDLRAFDGFGSYPVVLGNLIFHQFTEEELAAVGARLRASCRLILACEPQRRRLSQQVTAVVAPLLGASPVTLHDAHVSIAAGFQDDELPAALGLEARAWQWTCCVTPLGAYRMVAHRR